MVRLRVGVALILTDPVATEIEGLRRALGSRSRLAPHLTLVPPVNVAEDGITDALGVLRRAAAGERALDLRLGPAATFWPATPVLYLAVDGDTRGIGRLRSAVLSGPLARPITHAFVPHVTLAEGVDPALIPALVEALGHYRADVTVERVHLLRRCEDGAWQVMADAALGGPRVVGRGGLELELTSGEILDPESEDFLAAHGTPRPACRPWVVTARREGAVVGAATGRAGDELWIDRLVVDAACRGQGVGRQLLAEIEHLAALRGCRQALVMCRADDTAASWYASHGWHQDLQPSLLSGGADLVRLVRPIEP